MGVKVKLLPYSEEHVSNFHIVCRKELLIFST